MKNASVLVRYAAKPGLAKQLLDECKDLGLEWELDKISPFARNDKPIHPVISKACPE